MHIISGYVAIINGLNGTEHIKTNSYIIMSMGNLPVLKVKEFYLGQDWLFKLK